MTLYSQYHNIWPFAPCPHESKDYSHVEVLGYLLVSMIGVISNVMASVVREQLQQSPPKCPLPEVEPNS